MQSKTVNSLTDYLESDLWSRGNHLSSLAQHVVDFLRHF